MQSKIRILINKFLIAICVRKKISDRIPDLMNNQVRVALMKFHSFALYNHFHFYAEDVKTNTVNYRITKQIKKTRAVCKRTVDLLWYKTATGKTKEQELVEQALGDLEETFQFILLMDKKERQQLLKISKMIIDKKAINEIRKSR
jgi:hypothetical protein